MTGWTRNRKNQWIEYFKVDQIIGNTHTHITHVSSFHFLQNCSGRCSKNIWNFVLWSKFQKSRNILLLFCCISGKIIACFIVSFFTELLQCSKNMSNFVLWSQFQENNFSRNGAEKQVSEIWHQQNIQIESYCSNNYTDNCFAKMSLPPLQHQSFYKQRLNQTHIPLHSATFIPTFSKAIIQQNLVKNARGQCSIPTAYAMQ